MMFKQLYLRLRYWRQLRKGFASLPHKGSRKFVLVDGRLFLMNGIDPIVKVDTTTNEAESYKPLLSSINKDYDWEGSKTIHIYKKVDGK